MEKCYIDGECYDLAEGIDFKQDVDRWLTFLVELEDENNVMEAMLELAKENFIRVTANDSNIPYQEYEQIMNDRMEYNKSCINFISERLT